MINIDLNDSELETLIAALSELKRKKKEALGTVSTLSDKFTEKDFGIPEIDALFSRVKKAYAESNEPDDPMTPKWVAHGVCPYLVIRGNISDGFSFYGPFDNKAQVDAFIDRLRFNVDSCLIKTLDIPTH